MYEAYYGLRTHPFSLVPDPAFLYLGSKHKVALSLLEYGLLNRMAFTVTTGEPGTGKTTLLNAILERSERELTVGVLTHTHAGLGSLLPWVLMTFGLDGKGMDSVELYRTFARFLAQEHAKHRRVVLIVDEAQNLGTAMLEELRLLSNLNDGRRQPLQIILSGQPALRSLLQQRELVQFAQRISVDYHLVPFDASETPVYIRHRIGVAGGPATLFTDLACVAIHRLTGGNPRLINQVSDVSLAYGYAAKTPWITVQLVLKAAADRRANGILPLINGEVSHVVSDEEKQVEQQQLASMSRTTPPVNTAKPSAVRPSGLTLYDRGVAFKEAGSFKQAIGYFEEAARDEAISVKARIQVALCLRSSGRVAEAVTLFRRLSDANTSTGDERKQVRYYLARTLEAAGRVEDAVAHYQALRDEQSDYRDVTTRLRRLSGPTSPLSFASANSMWTRMIPRSLAHLIRSSS
jgi:type II secretory pathway predicted ATPase ExeA